MIFWWFRLACIFYLYEIKYVSHYIKHLVSVGSESYTFIRRENQIHWISNIFNCLFISSCHPNNIGYSECRHIIYLSQQFIGKGEVPYKIDLYLQIINLRVKIPLLWHSWKRGRFQHQRSDIWIQPSANFIYYQLY